MGSPRARRCKAHTLAPPNGLVSRRQKRRLAGGVAATVLRQRDTRFESFTVCARRRPGLLFAFHLGVDKTGRLIRVLITDGDERAALAATRALLASGYVVYVAARRGISLAGATRRARRLRVDADPMTEARRYAEAIGRAAVDCDVQVVLPITDASVEALLEHHEALPPSLILPLPDLETYRTASDKLRILTLAQAAGFEVPATLVIPSKADCADIRADDLFPVVVKPHGSLIGTDGGKRRLSVSFAEDAAALREALGKLPPEAFPVLVQHRVNGVGEGLFLLRWEGRVLAVFAHRRLREKPPAGGVSVYRESIRADPGWVAAGMRLLKALDWRGVAMIECKRDPASARHVIMEVNGRLWGSLQLAIDAGVDFPTLLVRSALGAPVAPPDGYRVGIRSRWFWGDVDHLYLRLTRSARALQLGNGARSRFAAAWNFVRFRPGRDREEVWRWGDPGPLIVETLSRVRLL